jgi:soluble lytic murein transglycosylase-like protein
MKLRIEIKVKVGAYSAPAIPPYQMPSMVYLQKESPDIWYKRVGGPALEKAYGLKRGILKALIHIESKGDPLAQSHKGAKGLFGIMPPEKSGFKGDPFNPMEAAKFAAQTLANLISKFGDYEKALIAYNWGRGNLIRKGLELMPEETQKYIQFFKDFGIL